MTQADDAALVVRALEEAEAIFSKTGEPALVDARALTASRRLAQKGAQEPVAKDGNPPFSNCKFRSCDLPGQCRDEGKCHHPTSPPAAPRAEPVGFKDAGYGDDDECWGPTFDDYVNSYLMGGPDVDPVEVGHEFHVDHFLSRPETWRVTAVDPIRCERVSPLSPPAREGADGWIPWEGGEQPVKNAVYVRVRLRDRDGTYREMNNFAEHLSWDDKPHMDGNIIAYRVSRPSGDGKEG